MEPAAPPVVPLPLPDALPIPAPLALVEVLLHFTFLLHVILMNLLLGGAIIGLVESRRKGDDAARLARRIRKLLPTVIAFTVTLGVAPLLFVQVIWGHLFYSAGVLMAWPWFLVIPVLIIVYYLAYAAAFRREDAPPPRLPGALVALGLLGIAFVYVNQMSLAIRPAAWIARWPAGGGFGWNLDDPTFAPRLLHFLLGAVAVAGLVIAVVGMRVGAATTRDHAVRTGAMWFLVATVAQFPVGFWLLMSLPRDAMLAFMGDYAWATALLGVTFLSSVVAVLLLALGHRRTDRRLWIDAAAVLALATVAGMVLMRDIVRDVVLAPFFDARTLATSPQTAVILVFVALLIAGVATVAWMVRRLLLAGR